MCDESKDREDREDREDYEEEIDSGPYCKHWSDPDDCRVVCATCGHSCCEHPSYGGDWESSCIHDDCLCEQFKDSEESEESD